MYQQAVRDLLPVNDREFADERFLSMPAFRRQKYTSDPWLYFITSLSNLNGITVIFLNRLPLPSYLILSNVYGGFACERQVLHTDISSVSLFQMLLSRDGY